MDKKRTDCLWEIPSSDEVGKKEITEFSNKKYKTQTSVYLDSFGEYGTIRWFCDFADLAALEKLGSQLMADKEYLQKVNQANDLLIHGSVFDTVMKAI